MNEAYKQHYRICKDWRNQGRPSSNLHPAKAAKLASQRNLQKIIREESASKAQRDHSDLMSTYSENMSLVCNKLKQLGENILKTSLYKKFLH